MTPRTELEWLGFELALSRHFLGRGGPTMATILTDLVRHPGVTRQKSVIAELAQLSADSVRVYICHIREEMREQGFSVVIENEHNVGWRIAPCHARQIVDRVTSIALRASEAA